MSSLDTKYFDVEYFDVEYYDAESSSDTEYFDAEYSFDTDFDTLCIPLQDLVIATNNFSEANLLKRGRKVADVYKGELLGRSKVGIDVVIWKYRSTLTFNFYEEIERLSGLKHRNIVTLIGFCDEEDERMIVMEHVAKGSLGKYLSDPTTLKWYQRLNICFGVACGLRFWHNVNKKGCFYNIKGGFKILLDENWEARVLFCTESDTKNYEVLHCLGVILLEMLYGRKSTIKDVHSSEYCHDMIDPNLRAQMHPQSLSIFSETAHNCLKEQLDQHRTHVFHKTMKRLKEAFQIQWKHENAVSFMILHFHSYLTNFILVAGN
ncbi:receptor-like protein kinase THESEUS 1 [Bidens hawaiensis]|uniref:receptor-like protein kinase THESEUS 1 n=1 Tax=Bidens hawaiensis TaxID=980011 RepID=UPI00404A1625